MKLPPLSRDGKPFLGSVKFEYADENSSGSFEIVDEAAGAFVVIRSDGAPRLDADELVSLAAWAKECCVELDEFNATERPAEG
jgi:hypothetical protein